MQPRARKILSVCWIVVLLCMLLPFALAPIVNLGVLGSIGWFIGIPLVIITFRRAIKDGHLQRPGWYRAALVIQLVVTVVGVVGASHTVLVDGRIGFVSVATVQLVTAILTWRAITRPDARRAVAAAMIALLVTVGALILDILLYVPPRAAAEVGQVFDPWTAVAVTSVFLSWIGGAVVCLAAINTFGPPTNRPDARAV